MYTRPAATVGLASSSGAGFPVITGGCQCHTWVAEAAFDGVNAVAGLTELCCGPCRYCGQSRAAPDAGAADTGLAAATGTDRTKPASPSAATSAPNPTKRPNLDIAPPSHVCARQRPSIRPRARRRQHRAGNNHVTVSRLAALLRTGERVTGYRRQTKRLRSPARCANREPLVPE